MPGSEVISQIKSFDRSIESPRRFTSVLRAILGCHVQISFRSVQFFDAVNEEKVYLTNPSCFNRHEDTRDFSSFSPVASKFEPTEMLLRKFRSSTMTTTKTTISALTLYHLSLGKLRIDVEDGS